jgi:energy-coupling factor transporter ATP-binding protein EcfA2
MLIEFSVENFLSFDQRVTLSLAAAPELDGPDGLIENTFEAPGGLRLLKSTLVYGANASGKSNLVKAMAFVQQLVLDSAKETQAGEPIKVKPFLLGGATEGRGSSFELIWIDGDARYRYGFSVDSSRVLAESLFRAAVNEETEHQLFLRDVAGIEVGDGFPEGRGVESKTRPNALFLSVVAQLNGAESERVLTWFRSRLLLASGVEDAGALVFTLRRIREGTWTEEILRLAREADLGITGVSVVDVQWPAEDKRTVPLKHGTLKVRHRRFGATGEAAGEADFYLDDESDGTQRFIALAGPLLVVLKSGSVLFLDELDARLHSRLARALVSLFHSESNPNNAQLVGATHDTNLLDRRLLRRDQIWFTGKDHRGATKLYSLAEFDLPEGEDGARYERDYLLGKYGAVPVIGELVKPETVK